jgi:hypothetical protein
MKAHGSAESRQPQDERESRMRDLRARMEARKEYAQVAESLARMAFFSTIGVLIDSGELDLDIAQDLQYLHDLVWAKLDDVIPEMNLTLLVHVDFIEVATHAVDANKPQVALVLIATAIEQILNAGTRWLLEESKGLSTRQATEVIRRTNIHAKLTWLSELIAPHPLDENLRRRILWIMQIRNAIVHYKAVPFRIDETSTWDEFGARLGQLDFVDLMEIPGRLEMFFESAREETDPTRTLARELADKLIAWMGHGHAQAGLAEAGSTDDLSD